jgi:hypothetical protein
MADGNQSCLLYGNKSWVWTWILSLSEHRHPWLFYSCLGCLSSIFFEDACMVNIFRKIPIFLKTKKALQFSEGSFAGRSSIFSRTSNKDSRSKGAQNAPAI